MAIIGNVAVVVCVMAYGPACMVFGAWVQRHAARGAR